MSEQLTEISEVMKDILEILKEYAAPQNWDGSDRCILGRQLAGIGLKRWEAFFGNQSDIRS